MPIACVGLGCACRRCSCDAFISIFAAEKCKMVEMSCEEHDQYAASSQFVTHLTGRMLSKVHTRQYYLPVCTRESQPPLRCVTLRRAPLNAHALRHCTRQADRPVCLFATSPQRACGLCLRFVFALCASSCNSSRRLSTPKGSRVS